MYDTQAMSDAFLRGDIVSLDADDGGWEDCPSAPRGLPATPTRACSEARSLYRIATALEQIVGILSDDEDGEE